MKTKKAVKNSWQTVEKDKYYFAEDKRGVKDKWVDDCYLGSDYKMLKDTTTPDGTKVDSEGKKVKEDKEETKEEVQEQTNKNKKENLEIVEQKNKNKQEVKKPQNRTITRVLTVPEMMCEGCEQELIGLFNKRGINAVADFTTKTVTVTTNKQISDSELVSIVRSAGWKVTSIR